MRMTFFFFSFCLLVSLLLPNDLTAQDAAPKRLENAEWKNIVHVKFHPGKRGRAIEIIKDHFFKAAEKAGTSSPEMMIEYSTGEWDLMLVWHMKGGIEDMTWQLSPDNIAWRKALNELEGGAEQGTALYQEYLSLIAHGKSEIGTVRK